MTQQTRLSFRSVPGLPAQLVNVVKVIFSKKPMLAPPEIKMGRTQVVADRVRIRASHLARYRRFCGIPDGESLPHAYPHALAMPLHMYVFTSPSFPVQVLGLIHLRNTIFCYKPILNDSELSLHVECDTMRETPIGQEYDLVTRCEVKGVLAWEEVSTFLARRAAPGQRPVIERAGAADIKTTFTVAANTGRRYARVSGDFNPIHISARTAGWFGFKQAVAHGAWSMSRGLGEAASQLPSEPIQIDTQFKLPMYLPSEVIFRCQRQTTQANISLSSGKGDRMHLAMQVKQL
jgi:acyl dehydratase